MRHGYSVNEEREPLPGQEEKPLPRNTQWLFFHRLAVDTTDEDVRQFLYSIGLDIPLEHISCTVRGDGQRASASVAIPQEQISYLVNCAINGQKLKNCTMWATLPKQKGG